MPVYSQTIPFDELPEALVSLPANPLVLRESSASVRTRAW